MANTAKLSLTGRARAWYTAAYRRIDDLTGDAYEARAAIAARYARMAGAPGTLAGLARADATSAALRRNFR